MIHIDMKNWYRRLVLYVCATFLLLVSTAETAFEKAQRKTKSKALLLMSINSFFVHLTSECQTPKKIWEKWGLYKSKDFAVRVHKGENALRHDEMRNSIKCFGCGGENHVIRSCSNRKKGHHECRNKPRNSIKYTATPADADGKKN